MTDTEMTIAPPDFDATGPCIGDSYFCEGTGAANLDPSGDTLALVFLCSPCATKRYLDAGEPTPGEQETAERDALYGRGA